MREHHGLATGETLLVLSIDESCGARRSCTNYELEGG